MACPALRVNAFPNPGSFMNHPYATTLRSVYQTIDHLQMWNWVYTTNWDWVYKTNGYSDSKEIKAIQKETGIDDSTFEYCMRHMEFIAKNGWIEYYRKFIMVYNNILFT